MVNQKQTLSDGRTSRRAVTRQPGAAMMDKIPVNDLVSMYLAEATQFPLLSFAEEIALARKIEQGRAADKMLTTAHNSHDLTNLKHTTAQADRARDHLIKANTRLVVSIAQKYMGRGLPFSDLIQEGNLGLIRAVEKFDYRQGYRFSTYATWWIRQNVVRALAEQTRTIRAPVHINDRLRKIYTFLVEFESANGRKPTMSELSAALDVPPKELRRTLHMNRYLLSLDQPFGDDDERDLKDTIQDTSILTPPDKASQHSLQEKMQDILCTLNPREAKIIQLRFGLHSGDSLTRQEIGQKFGLNRERIRQLEVQALRRLRHPRRLRMLRDFWVGM